MKMKIINLLGETIEITDYDSALNQARAFANYQGHVFVARGVSAEDYWKDIYEKLKKIKNPHP